MSSLPERNSQLAQPTPEEPGAPAVDRPADLQAVEPWAADPWPSQPQPSNPAFVQNEQQTAETPLFQYWYQPEIHPPARIPNFGHLLLLGFFSIFGILGGILITEVALHYHLYGISNAEQANSEIHYTLANMVVLYLIPFAACLIFFPLIWHKSFFAGLQWNAATALRMRKQLFGAACACFVLALTDGLLMPGPTNAPIDKLFQTRADAWLLFAFGVTCAPFFEEILFRGFLLPALCTVCDWTNERFTGKPPRPLLENGHPQWSMPAMVIGAILTSIPFAWMHAPQTGYSLGPFLLLSCVSMVLCWIRLSARSVASSFMVHACYNLLLFSLMLYGTSGFQHLDKM